MTRTRGTAADHGANTGSNGPQAMYRRSRLVVLQVNYRFYP